MPAPTSFPWIPSARRTEPRGDRLTAAARRPQASNAIAKRSVTINGHPTSVSVEDAFWHALTRLAERRGVSLAAIIGEIDAERGSSTNLSSAVRVFVLEKVQETDGER